MSSSKQPVKIMNVLCAICQDTMQDSSNDVSTTPCGHVFHYQCIVQSLERAGNCPICRRKVSEDKIILLHLDFEEDSVVKSKIDNFKSNIKRVTTELNKRMDENDKLRQENRDLVEKIENFEAVCYFTSTLILKYKQQISRLGSICRRYRELLELVKSDKSNEEKFKMQEELKKRSEFFVSAIEDLNG